MTARRHCTPLFFSSLWSLGCNEFKHGLTTGLYLLFTATQSVCAHSLLKHQLKNEAKNQISQWRCKCQLLYRDDNEHKSNAAHALAGMRPGQAEL